MKILGNLKLPASLDNLDKFVELVSFWARAQGFNEKKINKIELATEEALVNVFNYAYKAQNGEVEVTCQQDEHGNFLVEIIDFGTPFNIFSVLEPDINSKLEDKNIGGLGIFLIKKFTDDTKYRREGDKNILSLYFGK